MSYYSRRNLPWPVSLAIGLAALGFSFYAGVKTGRVVWFGQHVQAQVIDVRGRSERTSKHSHGTRYHPVLSFTDSLHNTVQFEDEVSSRDAGFYWKGQMLPVLYVQSTPVYAVADSGWLLWKTTGISAFIGIVFVGGAIARLMRGGDA